MRAGKSSSKVTDASVTFGSLRQSTGVSKGLTVKVKSGAAARPAASLREFAAGPALASATAKRSAKSSTLVLKPSSSGARTIRGLRDPTLTLVLKLTGPGGSATIVQRVTLSR